VILQIKPISIIKYPLKGYYEDPIEVDYNDFHISIKGSDFSNGKDLYKRWGIVNEGLTLSIQNHNINQNAAFETAKAITILLSIATGNDIKFDRQVFNENYIIIRRRKSSYYGFSRIIPSQCMQNYLN